jgi:hypothetical protein
MTSVTAIIPVANCMQRRCVSSLLRTVTRTQDNLRLRLKMFQAYLHTSSCVLVETGTVHSMDQVTRAT